MLTIFVLFVGLTLATAVIAYWSDNLGKKLGKKRVSLWGLRPRTTATFLTIASSWLIMIFTLGVMLAIFPPLRRSLLRYDEVQAKEQNLRKSAGVLTSQVGELNGQLTALRDQTRALQDQVSYAAGNLSKVQSQLKEAQTAAQRAGVARTKAQGEAKLARQSANAATARQQAAVASEAKARDNLKDVSAQLGATKAQREAARQQLKAAKSELLNANAEVKSANMRVKNANKRVKAATAKVKQAENRLTSVQTDLAQAVQSEKTAQANEKLAQESAKNAAISANNAGIAANKAGSDAIKAETQVLKAESKVAQLTAQGQQLQKTNDELNRVNTRLIDDNKRIRDTAIILSQSDVRVPVDSTLVERSFDQFMTALDVRDALRAMFNRGAQKIVPGLLPNAKLVLAEVAAPDGKSLLSDEEIYDNLVNLIVSNPNPLSVRLVAARNHLAGEDVLESRFLVVPIRPALPDNFELARIEVDGRIGEGSLFSALLDLVDEGTAVAKSKGVRPPLSPDLPNFYAPGSREQIFDALRAIKAINGPARVRILTTQPISTADQLRVKFEVEPISAVTTQATARVSPRAALPQ